MELFAPKYYKNFKCIAHKCEHSCCIGWEIDIDSETLNKYKGLKSPYGTAIRDSISYEGTPHFKLGADERCVHLDENGLCKIILNCGDECLCTICREHPRFYNYTRVAEVGLGMSCREAARLILSSPDYDEMERVGTVPAFDDEIEYDGIDERTRIYAVLQDKSMDYKSKLAWIYSQFEIELPNDSQVLEMIDSLEYLVPSHKEMFKKYSCEKRPENCDAYLERALAYFIYRHCTEAYDETDLRDRLAFCMLCEGLLASLVYEEKAEDVSDVALLASIISEEIEYSEDNIEALTY